MADLIIIKRWDGTPALGSGDVTFKDEDFGNPNQIKRIYGFSVTYKATVKVNMNAMLRYALDGGTTFPNPSDYVPTTELPVAATWNMAYIALTTPVSCQSIRVKLSCDSQIFRINDFAIEYRPIHKEVT